MKKLLLIIMCAAVHLTARPKATKITGRGIKNIQVGVKAKSTGKTFTIDYPFPADQTECINYIGGYNPWKATSSDTFTANDAIAKALEENDDFFKSYSDGKTMRDDIGILQIQLSMQFYHNPPKLLRTSPSLDLCAYTPNALDGPFISYKQSDESSLATQDDGFNIKDILLDAHDKKHALTYDEVVQKLDPTTKAQLTPEEKAAIKSAIKQLHHVIQGQKK